MRLLIPFKLLLLLILHTNTVNAQQLEIGFLSGIGHYQMSDLKDIQNQALQEVNIPGIKITDSFPIYFNYGLNLKFTTSKFVYGMFIRYESTGSRITYSDISGSYKYDQLGENILIGTTVQLFAKRNPINWISILPFFQGKAGIGLASISFEENLKIKNQSQINTLELAETSFFIEPGFGFRYKFKSLNIDPNISLHIPIRQNGLHLKGNEKAKLQNSDGDITANWFGFRAGINFSISL